MIRTALKRTFATRVDYYEVLGIPRSAKPADVKKAYKELAKKYHPDVAKAPTSQEKFRLITEAYSVLKNLDTRTTYDLTKGSKEEIQAILEKKKESFTGLQVSQPEYQPHEWGYKRLKELAEDRKKYNLDQFYRFRGGVPQKGMESVRGGARGIPGERVNSAQLNYFTRHGSLAPEDSKIVDTTEAELYKIQKDIDYHALSKKKPFIPAEIDYTLTKFPVVTRYIIFWTILGSIFGGVYVYDEIYKAENRMKIAKLKDVMHHGGGKVEVAGMRAVAFKG